MKTIIHKTAYLLYLVFAFLWYTKLLSTFVSAIFIIILYFFGYVDFFTSLLLIGLNLLVTLSYHIYHTINEKEKEIKINKDNLTALENGIFKLLGYFLILEVLTSSVYLLAEYEVYLLGLNILWLSISIIFCNLIIFSILLMLLKSSIDFRLSMNAYLFSSFIINYLFGASTAHIAYEILFIPKIYDLTIVTFLPIIIQLYFFISLLDIILTDNANKKFDETINSIISDYNKCTNDFNLTELEFSMLQKGISINNSFPVFIYNKKQYLVSIDDDEVNIYDNTGERIKNKELEKMIKYYKYINSKKYKIGSDLITKLIVYISNQTEKDAKKIIENIEENENAYGDRTDLEKRLSFSDLQMRLLHKKELILGNKINSIKMNYLIYPNDLLYEEARKTLLEINDLYIEWHTVLEKRSKLWDDYTEHIPIKYHDLENSVNKKTSLLISISEELSYFD